MHSNLVEDEELPILCSLEFFHSETAIYSVDITYTQGTLESTPIIHDYMISDTLVNTLRLDRTKLELRQHERVTCIAGVFSQQLHSLQLISSDHQVTQVNDFLRHFNKSFESRYSLGVKETISFINAGFSSSLS